MRQWKTTLLNDYTLDKRDREDILRTMKELAASYTPEWQLDTETPDIGSCIALLYADEMQELIRRYNTIPERNCVEMVNLLNISLRAAYPAHSIVLMDIVDHTVSGVKLKKGVKLLAESGEDEEITFETANTVFLTNSRISTLFMTSGMTGNVYPVFGDFPPQSYIEETKTMEEELEDAIIDFLLPEGEEVLRAFALFDFDKPDYGLHGMLLYHSHLFDVQDNDILIELRGGSEIIDGILQGDYTLQYWTEGGFLPITDMARQGEEQLVVRKHEACAKISEDGVEYSVLLIEPVEPVTRNVMVSGIGFSSQGSPQPVQNVWNGNCELEPDRIYPFGEVMSMYAELYLNHEEYFNKPGAMVTLDFYLDFGSKLVAVPRQEEEEQLRVIKRKPKRDIYGTPAEVFADEIVIEYYNGIGWKRLNTTAPVSQLFRDCKAGRCEISFECPKDWESTEEGSGEAHWLRIRLLQADNCYYQPAVHHYPILDNLTVSYTYQHHLDTPGKVICFQGNRRRDMTLALAQEPQIPVFYRNPYNTDSLYIGLDRKLEDGPVSIMIDVEEREGYSGRNIRYDYSTRDGFARLKLVDNTAGLEHTGTIVFIPPTDMAKTVMEGKEAYWLRITATGNKRERQYPTIRDVRINAVEVNNIDTLTEQDYYIDRFGPNMTFRLNADNILDAQVWVNEIDQFTDSEMRARLVSDAANTRAEYSLSGEIQEFYTKWEEVDNFDRSCAMDRNYVIDRQNSTISFGDGVHVRIPRNTHGIAFKTIVRCCDGDQANVEAGAINSPMGNLLFVNQIYNPMPAYGGMDMETLDEALRRGAAILGSRNRLISAMDYEREVLNFAGNISQVKTVVDVLKDGSRVPGAISVVLLMNDFKDGSMSFLKMKRRVREHLLSRCELSVDERYLDVVQPLFVRISAQLWVRLIETDDSFDMQQHLIGVLNRYLDPVTNPFWDIGRMVSSSQIGMQLNVEKGSALIEKVMLSASYEDERGIHEVDLETLKGNPYVLVMNGEHKVHFL